MYKADMKAFKSAMKLIVESQIAQPVDFRINKNTSEFVAKNDMWRLIVPAECETDIENITVKLTNESFIEIYKGLRAVRKPFSMEISEDRKQIKFTSKDDSELVITPITIITKEYRTFTNETLATMKIDDMLSFLNSVFAFRSNKFTPIDANIEIRFDQENLRLLHFTPIKMSRLILKNITKKEYRTMTIPTKEMGVAYSLFKNSLEFDGEIQENDNVLIFATNRFKLGLKKEHKESKPLEHLFKHDVLHNFKFNDELMNQLYAIKKGLNPSMKIQINNETIVLDEVKFKPSKDDIMVQINKIESGIKFESFLYKSVPEIGQAADGKMAFYDLSQLFEIAQSFIEPGFKVEILNNHMVRFVNANETVSVYLLPILPYKREIEANNE